MRPVAGARSVAVVRSVAVSQVPRPNFDGVLLRNVYEPALAEREGEAVRRLDAGVADVLGRYDLA